MEDIPYSRICVINVLRPCAIGFALRNVRDIFSIFLLPAIISKRQYETIQQQGGCLL